MCKNLELQAGEGSRLKEHLMFKWRMTENLRLKVLKIDDSAKGGLTQFWELFTIIPWAIKIFKTLITSLFEDIWVSN